MHNMGEASVCPRRRRRRYWRGLARGGGGAFRGRRWYLRKDFFVGSLQLSDLARHLILTGGELPDGYPHVAKLPRDSLLQRGDMLLYLLLLRVRRRSGGVFERFATVGGVLS